MKLHIVPARTGFRWVKLGIQAFFKQPLALTGLFFLFMATLSVVNLVPVLGSLASLVLLPSVALGLMAAAQQAHQGRFPMPSILLAALRAAPQAMLQLGALYALGFMAALGLSALFDGGEFARIFLLRETLDSASADTGELPHGMLVFMVLHLPLSLAFWHAPALVHWHGISPLKSLFFSLVACWRNKGAYLVFGLSWFAVVMVEGVIVQILAMVLGQPDILGLGAFVVTLLTTSMFLTSIYFTFRDSFETETPEPATLLEED